MKSKLKHSYDVTVVLLLIGCISWVFSKFVHLGNVEFTDNAQVKQQIVPVQTRVQGYVKKIYFGEYQEVTKGDTLIVIDDAEYRYRLTQAEADYQNALVGKQVMGTWKRPVVWITVLLYCAESILLSPPFTSV